MTGDRRLPRYRRSSDALWRRVGSSVVVTTASDPEVHELLGGASSVWAGLAQPRSMAELLDHLSRMHEVSQDAIRAEVSAAVEQMREADVIEEVR